MPLPDFHVSEPFTLGIELEMQVLIRRAMT
ncbi:carboxylate-amine ligase [Escherichia coli]|uniref:Carboxylate-amine ligase n=1 Tax=Escherichia coli TaxID=562 RepID=A0A376VZN3_ECOLX|nr:carboxylate-amine ligase [Escherichia coli]